MSAIDIVISNFKHSTMNKIELKIAENFNKQQLRHFLLLNQIKNDKRKIEKRKKNTQNVVASPLAVDFMSVCLC